QVFLSENNSEDSAKAKGIVEGQEEQALSENGSREENLAEPLIEKIKDIVAQMPSEAQHVDEMLNEILPKKSAVNDIEVFASEYQQMPVFERKDRIENKDRKPEEKEEETESTPEEQSPFSIQQAKKRNDIQRQKSLNDTLN